MKGCNLHWVTQWAAELGFGSRICHLNQDKGVFASLISCSARLDLSPSGSCLPNITHSSYKLKPKWFPWEKKPQGCPCCSLKSKEEMSKRKTDSDKEGKNRYGCWWKHCKKKSCAPSFWPVGKACISGRPKASPIVLLPACLPLEHPRISLVQISLPYSLPPMEVLRIVSFCPLLNV